MRLYVRISLGLIAAIIVLFTVMAAIKYTVIDPERRARMVELAGGGLLATRDAIREAPDQQAALTDLARYYDRPLQIAGADQLDRPGRQGNDRARLVSWNGDRYVAADLDDSRRLLLGPIPDVDPDNKSLLLLLIGVTLVIAVLAGLLLVAPVTRRLRQLERAAGGLAAGDLSTRAEVGPADAIGNLATRFNEMAAEIERLIVSKRQLLQAVSHEFRTPTSRIRFALELMDAAKSDAERADKLATIDESLVEIDDLVDELLTYARFDGEAPDLDTEELDAAAVINQLVESVRGLRRDIEIEVVAHDGDESPRVLANRRYFRRAVGNLLNNALRHARSQIRIEYQRVADELVVLVHDDGPGVPIEQRSRVFEPFARLDNSRSRDSGGFGLGLAIVQRILDWHGGSATVDDSDLGGAMFVSSWPLASGAPLTS